MEMGDVHPLNLLEHILVTGADGMVYRTWLLNNELIQYTVQMLSLIHISYPGCTKGVLIVII